MTYHLNMVPEILKHFFEDCKDQFYCNQAHFFNQKSERICELYSKATDKDIILSDQELKELEIFLFQQLKFQPHLAEKIPGRLIDITFLCKLSERSPAALLYFSKDVITIENVKLLLKRNLILIHYLIRFPKQKGLWSHDRYPLYIPDDILYDTDFIRQLIYQGVLLFENVPEEYLTEEIVKETLIKKLVPFRKVPKKFATRKLLLEVIKIRGEYIFEVPYSLLDEEVMRCVFFDGKMQHYIRTNKFPLEYSNEDVSVKITRSYPFFLSLMPKEKLSQGYLNRVFDVLPGDYIDRIPQEFINEEIALYFCSKDRSNVRKLPMSLGTKSFILRLAKIVSKVTIYFNFHIVFDRELFVILMSNLSDSDYVNISGIFVKFRNIFSHHLDYRNKGTLLI